MKRARTIQPPVFLTATAGLVVFMVLGVTVPTATSTFFGAVLEHVVGHFGWFFILSVSFFVGFLVWLAASRYGRIRLGPDDSRPEFSTLSWFAMLFSAGMGIGLLFYSVAEPMMHYASPPEGPGRTDEAAQMALPLTFFHWGIHGWAIYVVMGLSIGYFSYRKGLPLTIRSAFYPLVGDRIYGWFGHSVDILAVLGTLFGVATTLGLGATQINAGLGHLFGIPQSVGVQLAIILVVTAGATISLVTGVKKGIRRLSELNILLACCLLLFVLVAGPTQFLLDSFGDNVALYIRELPYRSFYVGAVAESTWIEDWTIFYWAWWIAWSPFVGLFIARISRGRTIREMIVGVIVAPTVLTFIWMTVFGDTALYFELFGGGGLSEAVEANFATAIYELLDRLPWSAVTVTVAIAVVALFFVTSSDSASFIVDMLASGGHPNPPVWQRIYWACAEGAVAGVMLFVGGPAVLRGFQAAVVSIGLPFCALMILMCISLVMALRREPLTATAARPLEESRDALGPSERSAPAGAAPKGPPSSAAGASADPVGGE